jgi:hypothetical protein
MATITVQEINGPYVGSADTTPMSTLTWTAASTAADTIVIPNKRLLLLLRNSGATPRAVTVASNFDAYGRKADISGTNIAAGAIWGRIFEPHGWEQSLGGKDLSVTAAHAEVLIAAIALD